MSPKRMHAYPHAHHHHHHQRQYMPLPHHFLGMAFHRWDTTLLSVAIWVYTRERILRNLTDNLQISIVYVQGRAGTTQKDTWKVEPVVSPQEGQQLLGSHWRPSFSCVFSCVFRFFSESTDSLGERNSVVFNFWSWFKCFTSSCCCMPDICYQFALSGLHFNTI